MKRRDKIIAGHIAQSLIGKKERLIERAISNVLGKDDWSLSEIKNRGSFVVLPDKTEKFRFDGIDLIHFGHVKTYINNGVKGVYMSSHQDYTLLYDNKAASRAVRKGE